jgi:hypothetical protein
MLAERGLRARQAARSVRALVLVSLLVVEAVLLILVFHPDYPGLRFDAFVRRAVGSLWTVLDVIPAELVIVLGTMFAFGRGIHAAVQDVLAPEGLHFRFRLGILILAAFGLIFRQDEGRLMLETLPLFFGAGLLALAVSRVDRAPAHAGGESGALRLAWVGAMLAVILVTILLAQGVSILLRSPIAAVLVDMVMAGLLQAVRALVIVLGPLIQVIGAFLAWLIGVTLGALGGTSGLAELARGIESFAQTLPSNTSESTLWIQGHARQIVAVGTALILVLLTVTVIRGGTKGSRRGATLPVDEVEATTSGEEGSRPGGGPPGSAGRRRRRALTDVGGMLAATTIRRIYGRLLRKARSRGRARSIGETPLEFLPVLRGLFPYHTAEVELITRAYLEVRYGGRLDEEAGIAEVRRAWAGIQAGSIDVAPSTIGREGET